MKRGRVEDKDIIGPLFPRLHVNDTGKGGPRAPPRNKMALYEQLSITTQRFNAVKAVASSASLSQDCGYERGIFSPFYMHTQTPEHLSERVHSCSSDGMSLNPTMMDFGRISRKHVNDITPNSSGVAAEYSLLHPYDSFRAKNYCGGIDGKDDLMVPTFVQSDYTASLRMGTAVVGSEKLTPFCGNSPQKRVSSTFNTSFESQTSTEKPLEQTNTYNMKSGNSEINHKEEKTEGTSVIREPLEESVSDKELGEKFAEPSNFAEESSSRDHSDSSDAFKKSFYGSTKFGKKSCNNDALGAASEAIKNSEAVRLRKDSFPIASIGNDRTSPNMAEKRNRQSDGRASGSLEVGDSESNDEVSEASIVDSIPGTDLSPDDVVGVIGSKQFWKTRRAIVNQQRVFAVQVFELHRLIKVQKLIAASPHLLLEVDLYRNQPPEAPAKDQQPPSPIVKQEDDFKKSNPNIKNTVRVTALPSREDELRSGTVSRNPLPIPITPENKATPWPSNQWLVPIMSPSEGLVYKPYCHVASSHQQPNTTVISRATAIASGYCATQHRLQPMNQIISHELAEQLSRSSCNMSNQNTEAFSGVLRKLQASKDSELQGSTASSPCEKVALPLFPTDPAAMGLTQPSSDRNRVIKVVPHNATTATESAARIFQSIQEERQHYDS